MLSVLIQLCLLLIVVCTATESFRPSTHARIRKFSSDLAAARRIPSSEEWRRGERPPMRPHTVPGPPTAGTDIRLLDIVLAASIDGHFHALNRTTGELLWSMTDDLAHVQSPRDPDTASAPSMAAQSPLYNLVRSDHRSLIDPNNVSAYGDNDMETYVVEPQSGDIFLIEPNAPADVPVERLGYSVPQLVELSPFRPPGDDDRIFIGKKTTSLISLDLLTGRILGVYGERCAWDDNETDQETPLDIDAILDDLDGTREIPKKQRPVEVVIGRTDYHLSVHVKGRGVVQNLSFTKYGPNNVHRSIQAAWNRSPDGTYFQPSPEHNRLYSFAHGGLLRFEHTYPLVVAIFDAVFLPTKRNPILLLQPIPKLSDLSAASTSADMDMPEVTFVGRIDDSLFALSHTNYPLVVFTPIGKKPLPRIDDGGKTIAGPHSGSSHGGEAEAERCYDLDCFVGTRWSQPAARSAPGRLLDDKHVLGITGSIGVEAQPESEADAFPEQEIPQSQSRSRAQTKTKAKSLDAPHPTRTTTHNGSSNAVPSPVPDEDAEFTTLPSKATPSHRTMLRALAGEWIAAWAGMGTVLLSTVFFGVSLVSKGKVGGTWKGGQEKIQKADPQLEEESNVEDEEDDIPPPVPPKPAFYSLSKMAANPYVITNDSRPQPPSKDSVTMMGSRGRRVRPRARSGIPSSASVPVLPTANLASKDVAAKSIVNVHMVTNEGEGENEETEAEVDPDAEQEVEVETPKKKTTRRGRRGGKGRGKGKPGAEGSGSKEDDVGSGDAAGEGVPAIAGALSEGSESFVKIEKTPVVTPKSSLVVTEDVLGYGSHGTVVYKGRFQGRFVAVKRLLHDFVTLASREVALLQESDDHPNVIRYYYEERRDNFLYIALELCPCSLADLVERPMTFPEVSGAFDPKRALAQVTAGLKHLHALKIVHRDIKPQNILVSARGAMLISDFGLCRKLDIDQTSFLPTVYGNAAAGTAGWRAPEILRGEVKLDTPELDVSSGGTGSNSAGGTATGTGGTRLTRSVDVFALGCLFYYVLSNGDHPFGSRYERDGNIMKDLKKLDCLTTLGEEGIEAIDLIEKMLSAEPKARPDTTGCLTHPYFWNPGRRLAFLQDASDRFEIMEREPREPGLVALETGAVGIVGADWQRKLDKMFIDNLGKFRKYDVKSVQDLLRALRNKKNHYQDLPDNVKRHLGPLPEGFLAYFTKRYPKLFLHVYGVIQGSSLRYESMFRSYFMLEE